MTSEAGRMPLVVDAWQGRTKTRPERPARQEVRALLDQLKHVSPEDAAHLKARVVAGAKVIQLRRSRQLELFSETAYAPAPPEKQKKRRRPPEER